MTTILIKCPPKAINLGTNKIYSSIHFFSSNVSHSIVSVKSYSNADTQKKEILKENKGLSGIYGWINNVNGKSYIGSAVNLYNRFLEHFNGYKSNILLQQAFEKYGLENFSLYIFEYCDKSVLLEKEQYYLNLLNPEYNILKNADSRLGLIHTLESRKKMSEVKLAENNPFFGKTHSEDTKFKMSQAKKGVKHPFFGKIHSEVTKDKISQAQGITIYVYNLNNELLYTFTSATRAGQHLKSKAHTILKYAHSGEIFKKEYILSLKILSSSST